MISSRYALPVLLLLILALVPTVIHNYVGLLEHDGRSVTEMPEAIGTYASEPTKRSAQWVQEVFDATDWIERIYVDQDGNRVRLFAASSYDHKKLYHHPELALSYGQRLNAPERSVLAGSSDMPVHLLRDAAGTVAAAYVLYYDGSLVEDPVRHQIRDAFKLLLQGRGEMTLFYVAPERRGDSLDGMAQTLLQRSIEGFAAQGGAR